MASFDDFLAQLKEKKASENDIPMERPADDTGVLSALQNGMPEATQAPAAPQPSAADMAALQANTQALGIPSVTIPYRNDSDSAIPPMGIANGGQLPEEAAPTEEAPAESQDIVKALKSIGGGSKPAPTKNTTPPTASAAPILPATKLTDTEFNDAQALADKRRMIAGMLASGEEIGRGISGLGAGAELNSPKSAVIKGLEENANQSITDLTAKRKAATEMLALQEQKDKSDPNSDVSKAMREAMQKSGMTVSPTATYSSMEKMFPVLMHHQDMQAKIAEMLQAKQLGMAQIMSNKQVAASAKATDAQSKAFDKTHAMLEQMRGNPAVQQAERDLYATDKINTLVAPFKGNLDSVSPQMVNLLKTELTKVASGGTSTEAAFGHLDEGTLKSKFAGVSQKFLNEPTGANAGAFLKQYLNYSNGLAKDAQKTISDRYGRILEPAKSHLNNDDYKTLDATYTNRFSNNAEAAPKSTASKGTVSQATVQDYASKHNMDAGAAADLLTKSGYVIK